MLDHFIESRDTVRQLRSGVIGSQLDAFATHLAQCGYAAATVRAQLNLLGHFSQWLSGAVGASALVSFEPEIVVG